MPPAAARMLKGLALVVCAGLAVESAIEAAVLDGNPRLAGAVHCDAHCATLLAGPVTDDAPPSAEHLNLARARLRDTPLDAPALRMLARHEGRSDPADGQALLLLAERVTRRDALTQAALADAAIRARDPDALMRHVDRLLSTSPGYSVPVATVLVAGLAKPDLRDRLAGRAARPWFGAVMTNIAEKGQDPQAITELALAASRRLPPADRAPVLARAMNSMLSRRQFGAASAMLSGLPGAVRRELTDAGFAGAAADPAWAPLAWTLRNDEYVATEIARDALVVRIAASHRELAAERMTMLAPGAYRFRYRAGTVAGTPAATAIWQVDCAGGAMLSQDRQPADGARREVAFRVPSDCAAQRWQFSGDAAESQYESMVRIDGLAIDPDAGQSAR